MKQFSFLLLATIQSSFVISAEIPSVLPQIEYIYNYYFDRPYFEKNYDSMLQEYRKIDSPLTGYDSTTGMYFIGLKKTVGLGRYTPRTYPNIVLFRYQDSLREWHFWGTAGYEGDTAGMGALEIRIPYWLSGSGFFLDFPLENLPDIMKKFPTLQLKRPSLPDPPFDLMKYISTDSTGNTVSR